MKSCRSFTHGFSLEVWIQQCFSQLTLSAIFAKTTAVCGCGTNDELATGAFYEMGQQQSCKPLRTWISLIILNWITPKDAALVCCCSSFYRRTALECFYMSLCNLGLSKWFRINMAWRFLRVILHCPLSGLLTLVSRKVCFVFLYSR